jgi:hypothetical protein
LSAASGLAVALPSFTFAAEGNYEATPILMMKKPPTSPSEPICIPMKAVSTIMPSTGFAGHSGSEYAALSEAKCWAAVPDFAALHPGYN